MNRRFPATFVLILVASALSLSSTGCRNTILNLMENQVVKVMTTDPLAALPDGLHVLVCGAGGPLPSENRTPACLLVIAGETVMLFDAGASTTRNLALEGFPVQLVERVFITHFHSDHIDGLGEAATIRWAGGSWETPLPVHGPHGVAEVVSGLNLAYRRDQTYRTEHHGLAVTPPNAAGLSASPFDLPPEGQPAVVFEGDDLRVLAYAVDHDPVSPAVGYRVEYKDRSISISGDTAKSASLESASQGVDVLFHEALSRVLVGVMNKVATDTGNANMAKITADILDYHASPVEAAESATTADVGALVIYHVVPPLPLAPLERIFKEGMDDAYHGPIEISVDGTFISLPAGSDEIEIESP